MTKLLAVDDAKIPTLFYALRGEAVQKAVKDAEKRALTVRLTAKRGHLLVPQRALISGTRMLQ